MQLVFACENCGKRFQIPEGAHGKRGRCKNCGHVMRIPEIPAPGDAHTHVAGEARRHDSAATPFRLSPAEPRPGAHDAVSSAPLGTAAPHGHHIAESAGSAHETEFELTIDQDEADRAPADSPENSRRLGEIEEFKRKPSGYHVIGDQDGFLGFFRGARSRPAGWLFVKWRAMVGMVLKVLRLIDSWAYLISVPFLVLMLFAIASSSRALAHTGAVVVVLANYGRFWADLLSFFVRPFKDGPLHGLAFLFPPYALYYLATRWNSMKPIVRRMVTSCIPIVLVIAAYAFLPSVNPAVKDVQGIGARLESGKAEIDREIAGDLREIESEIAGAVERKQEPPPTKP